jgi:hypothetical protein
MMRTPAMIVGLCLVLVAPAAASTPLDYTRTVLQRARTIVAGNETHNEKLAALSALFGKFLDSDAMAAKRSGRIGRASHPTSRKSSLPSSASFSSEPMWGNCCSSKSRISFMRASS